MAAYFTLTLDTTAPGNGSISVTPLTAERLVTLTLSADDAFQMKLYGDIGAEAATAEANAAWETYAASKSVQLTSGDGAKTVKVNFRDAVGNETTEYTASTVLDTTAPIVTITGPDVPTVSKVSGYNVSSFTFSADTSFLEWSVRVVPSASSLHTAGTEIGAANGSTNMSGAAETAGDTPITCTVNAADLEAASSGDGAKIIKVFVKDPAGNWSV